MELKSPSLKEQKAFAKSVEKIQKEEGQKRSNEAIEAFFRKEERS
jgi:hypothetical protein